MDIAREDPELEARPKLGANGSFVLTVDVEPDDRLLDPRDRPEWTGFLALIPLIEPLRERLRVRTGRPARFSWFIRMDPQIETAYGDAGWAVRRYANAFEDFRSRGDSFGLHHHAYRWLESERVWISDHANADWIDAAVSRACSAFARALGSLPESFRFGDRWLSGRLVERLDRLGIRHDLTLEPGLRPVPALVPGEKATGSLPDFRLAPRFPYRPSRSNYLEPGRFLRRRRLWIVPVSTGCVNGPALPAEASADHDFVHLNLGLDPVWIRHILDGVMEEGEPVVVSVARTGDLASPLGREQFRENLEYVASHPGLADRVFEGPRQAVSRWRAGAARGKSA